MQHVRQVSGNYFFTRSAPEAVLLFGQDNLAYLADYRLSLWCEHSHPTSNLQTSAISDLRLYLDGQDVTTKVRSGIVAALQARQSARQEYVQAMDRWIEILAIEAPVIGLKPDFIAQQRKLAKQYGSLPWTKLFESLKTEGFGYRGGLHPLHYVFREVLIRPISLRAALYPEAKPEERPFNKRKDPRFIVSHGPCRLYAINWKPVQLQYEGNISIALEPVLDDAWELEMRQRMLDIVTEVTGLSDRVLELKARYSEFELRAAEFKLLAESIESSLKEISP
jgi:hypothetical protein